MQPVTGFPIERNQQEEHSVKSMRKAKLYIFVRKPRHAWFAEAFRAVNWHVCIAKQNEDNHPSPRRSWRLSLILCLSPLSPGLGPSMRKPWWNIQGAHAYAR